MPGCTGIRGWCCGRSSSVRPIASSRSSTQGHGKVRAVAKGVRKPGSRFGARLEPTTHVAFQCYRGRGELDVVTQVETIDANRGAPGALRVPHPRGVDARGRRPGRAGPRAQPRAVPDARAGAPHARGVAVAARERGLLLEAPVARGLPPAARRVRALRRPVRGRSRPSTSTTGACCASRARARRSSRPARGARAAAPDPRRRAARRARRASRPRRPSTSSGSRSPRSSTTSNDDSGARRSCSRARRRQRRRSTPTRSGTKRVPGYDRSPVWPSPT